MKLGMTVLLRSANFMLAIAFGIFDQNEQYIYQGKAMLLVLFQLNQIF